MLAVPDLTISSTQNSRDPIKASSLHLAETTNKDPCQRSYVPFPPFFLLGSFTYLYSPLASKRPAVELGVCETVSKALTLDGLQC